MNILYTFILNTYMRICLAPMDGITDLAYRTLCKEIFSTYGHLDDELMLWTEFMSADGFVINPKGVIKHLFKSDFEPELIAQIFGGNAEMLITCAQRIEQQYNFAGIEINMGCPSPSVMKCDAGSAMLKDKKKTLAILNNLSLSLQTPLSLKTRAGLTENDKQAQFDFLLEASQYVWMIIVHGRTYKQSHSGDVDWSFIYELKKALPDKVIIGNGGIRSYEHASKQCKNLDGIMIGQSAIGDPRILTPHSPSIEERFATILRHLSLMITTEQLFLEALEQMDTTISMPCYDELCKKASTLDDWISTTSYTYRSPREFRKYLFRYINGLPENKMIKKAIPTWKDFQSLRSGIEDYKTKLLHNFDTSETVGKNIVKGFGI